ncbi:hypothetical protein [Nocardia sp. NBC_01329]|uniref:hypothetical protein n=1 Tax=Nocardia sp. NBC_01329 TaxID=2903594 RepID=UPI002E11B186|nr:hypothetical protein OG405_28950 [Nocardia sp. NBC_01329]
MTAAKVYIVDRIETMPGRAREFVDRYLAEYVPGAIGRGMTLAQVLVAPPLWLDDRSNTVTVMWELDGPAGWWEMTWKGRPDPELGRWWAGMDQLIVRRTRESAAAAADIEALADV